MALLNLVWLGLAVLGPALLALGVTFFSTAACRRRRGKAPPSLRAVTGLLAGAMGLTWLLSMGAMTLVTASQLLERLTARSNQFGDRAEYLCGLAEYYDPAWADSGRLGRQYEYPEEFVRSLLEGAHFAGSFELTTYTAYSRVQNYLGSDREAFETAVAFLDGYGQSVFEGDILFFPYVTAEQWADNISENYDLTEESELSYGWVRLPEAGKEDPYRPLRKEYAAAGTLRERVRVLRVTAEKLPSEELRLLSLDYVSSKDYSETVQRCWEEKRMWESGYFVDDMDRAGLLRWTHAFGEAETTGEGAVTLYALDPELYLEDTSPVAFRSAGGEKLRYDSLQAMLREGSGIGPRRSLLTVLTLETRYYKDPRDGKTLDLIMRTAVVAHPLKSAVKLLWPVYLALALFCLALTIFIRFLLQRRLMEPLGDVLGGMAGGWYHLLPDDDTPLWREAEQLREKYRAEEDHRRYEAYERQRLQRALDYAKAAEEERRLLTSNLAHELKTPLAVVHSYAEGLREHIAEEKREQYLDTILSESERMDALVMQMLDLSRLEAGRVKLSRDDFDLRALAEAGVEKLRPLAEERGLRVILEPGEACEVAADESRIAQAAENLLVNALRYAPAGSRVRLAVEKAGRQAVFRVENPVEKPFSPEEREKVWEPFYRRDKARSGPGTGLGLSIVRQIVELHGGACILRNTPSGVEFGFTLPL